MIFRGKVQNRHIELPAQIQIPEGAEVEVTISLMEPTDCISLEPDTDTAEEAVNAYEDVPTVKGKPHVLVVDDMEPLRELAEFVLMDAGYRVTLAESTDDAIAVLDADKTVSLVLTDLDLPGKLTGLGMAQMLQSKRPNVAVLLTSGYAADITPDGKLHGFPFIAKTAWSEALTEKVKAGLVGE
jgi:CheY-like chemotaxis protein